MTLPILLTLLLAAPGPASSHAAAVPLAVVASDDVPAENLTSVELRQLFLLDRRFWKPGQPATVLFPPSGSLARDYLLRRVCRADERELRRMFLEKMYRGELDLAPKVVDSDAQAVAFVASGHGLLALVPAGLAARAAVKVLRIDGLRPGDKGYRLTE